MNLETGHKIIIALSIISIFMDYMLLQQLKVAAQKIDEAKAELSNTNDFLNKIDSIVQLIN